MLRVDHGERDYARRTRVRSKFLAPLSPVLRGEGLGVRGDSGAIRDRKPSSPALLPRGEGSQIVFVSSHTKSKNVTPSTNSHPKIIRQPFAS
jgi:hypothetical protein